MADNGYTEQVAAHYTAEGLGEKILAGLKASGKDPDNLSLEDLAPVDQFHTGGREATLALMTFGGIQPGATVLDVGGGIGGSARLLASKLGCHVTVLDLTEEFCKVGAMLTERTGLSDLVTFRQGNALAMPFEDNSFDVVWTQHASMNIEDKARLYAEMFRVLRPGGRFVLHDNTGGAVQPIHFPVPWARTQATSFLLTQDEMRALLAAAGFREISWADRTPEVAEWFRVQAQRQASQQPTSYPLGMHLVVGPEFATMIATMGRNVAEGRVTVAEGILEKP